ncbi:zinc dependent phospholipase C family protein [Thermodesulfobacteriota bacterium]
MLILKVLVSLTIFVLVEMIFSDSAWAWGPAIHTVISCSILDRVGQILPAIASIIEVFSLEYIYGSMAADFFIGRGYKKKKGHSHNWETGFRLLHEAKDEKEAAYAYGFLSHLAADVVAHNYFVPDLIHRVSTWKRMGHIYSEAVADKFVGPLYIRIAREVLNMEKLDCDKLLKSAVRRSRHGLKTKRRLFTQSVKISDYLYCLPRIPLTSKNSRYRISSEYLAFMIGLSYRLVNDLLSHPDSSPCLSHDPIGSQNLSLASQNGVISKLFNNKHPTYQFPVDQELLEL